MKNAMQLKAILKNMAKQKNISAQLVLQNYMLERLLERVSVSKYRNNFILKGGFLIAAMVGLDTRATMDMDATLKGYPVNEETVRKMFEEICAIELNDDVTFAFRQIGEIREGDEYTGYRVALTANYPPLAVPLKLDITTGDKITPREIEYSFKLLLEDRSISILAYAALRKGLAEKLGGVTCMIVAQRIGTIRNADKIVVLDEGKAVGIGTHEELIKNCAVYREIAMSQLSAEELGA